MDRPTWTLLVSLVRRAFPMLASQIALTALLCILLRDVNLDLGQRGFRPRDDLRTLVETGSEEFLMGLLLVGVNALVAGGTILLIHSDAKRLKLGLPMRMFLLPMTFGRILLVHMLLGATTVAVAVSVAAAGSQWLLESQIRWWIPVCLCTAAFSMVQTWAFTVAERRRSVALGSLVVLIALLGFAVRLEPVGRALTESPAWVLALSSIVVVSTCIGVSYTFGRDMRYSAFDGAAGARRSYRSFKPFGSPFAAQFWFEWRRVGWVLPAVSGTSLLLFYFGLPLVVALFMGSDTTGYSSWVGYSQFFTIQWETSVHMVVTAVQTTAVAASVLSGAYAVMISGEWRGRHTFLRARPLPTSRLGTARIAVMALSAALSLLLMMALTFGMSALVGLEESLSRMAQYLYLGYQHVPRFLILTFFWGTIFLALWLGLWIGECTMVAAAYLAPGAVLFLLAGVAALAGFDGAYDAAESVSVWIGSAICLAGTLLIVGYSIVRGLISKWRVGLAAVLYLFYCSVFVYFGLDYRATEIPGFLATQDWAIPFPHPINWPLWIGLSVLPILPLFSHPALLERWRTNGGRK